MPSWIYYLKWGEIVSVYAYSFLVNFLESVALLLVMLLAGFVLPAVLWRDQFVAKSVIAEIIIIGSAIYRMHLFSGPDARDVFVHEQWTWWTWTLLLLLILSFLIGHVRWLRTYVESLAERFIVFLYFYIPITIISVFVIIGRFLF